MKKKPTPSEKHAARKERRYRVAVTMAARRLLNVSFSAPNAVLFQTVQLKVGQAWNGTKSHGYAMCLEYVTSMNALPVMPPDKPTGAVCRPMPAIPATTEKPSRLVPVTSKEFLETYQWRALRMRVLVARGSRCECCGATPKDGIRINVDHIKPRVRYPELALEESNLQVLCEVCNHGKGNWDETDWREPQVS